MKLSTFYDLLYRFRAYVIALILICLFLLAAKASARIVDVEGPSGEAMILEQNYENDRNKEAFDRVVRGEAREGDTEKASRWVDENVSRHTREKE